MKSKIASAVLTAILLASSVFSLATPAWAAFQVPNPIQRYGFNHFRIRQGLVQTINGTTMTVQMQNINEQLNGKTITVLTDSNTKFKRRYWGDSSISEISVGDHVNVQGSWTDDTKTTLQARWVRDTSIQKFRGTFFGTVSSKTDTNFVLASNRRGNQTVMVSSTTQFVDTANKTIAYSDIKASDRVRVKGVWDRKTNVVNEVTQVKDFSIPATSSASPTP